MSRYSLGIIELSEENREDLWENTKRFRKLHDIRGKFNIAYGFDNVCGYFLQVFPIDDEGEGWLEDMDVDECFGLDSTFDGLTGAELAYFIRMFNGNIEHADLAGLDMPF
jgi:hypothetical protein